MHIIINKQKLEWITSCFLIEFSFQTLLAHLKRFFWTKMPNHQWKLFSQLSHWITSACFHFHLNLIKSETVVLKHYQNKLVHTLIICQISGRKWVGLCNDNIVSYTSSYTSYLGWSDELISLILVSFLCVRCSQELDKNCHIYILLVLLWLLIPIWKLENDIFLKKNQAL